MTISHDYTQPMYNLQPITKELLDTLDRYERSKAKKMYQAWVKSARKKDKRQVKREHNRVLGFKFKMIYRPFFKRDRTITRHWTLNYHIYLLPDGTIDERFYIR